MCAPVYLDHAATTPVDPEVLAVMQPYMDCRYANASALHTAGREAQAAVEHAREQVAAAIGASPDEVFFTSGGTEADNWALKGIPLLGPDKPEVLVSAVEHPAVLRSAEALARQGCDVDVVGVSPDGRVEPKDVEKRISLRTRIVSVMHANNETGAVQPVAEIGRICHERGCLFHVDAVQSLGHLAIDVREIGADLVSLSGHKVYGPKGIGALYVRRGVAIGRWMDGGSQEAGLRGGTANVPAIVGFGHACDLLRMRRDVDAYRLRELRDHLAEGLTQSVRDVRLTSADVERLPGHVHVCVRGVEGEAVLIGLDAAGVMASGGAACSAGAVTTSHVLRAMGMADEWARGAVRFTLGRSTIREACNYCVSVFAGVVSELRGT